MKQLLINEHQSKSSESVKCILKELNAPTPETLTLNYGNGVSKLKQYQFFTDNNIPSPEWTTDRNIARQWIQEGCAVVCRTRIKGQSGAGITIAEIEGQLVDSKVYTKYIPKKREFRVNIYKDKVVNVREKVGKVGTTNTKIRNNDNGYSTVKLRSRAPEGLEQLALKAAKVSSSDFKGVDIGYNQYRNLMFVLEVNSGPSIEGASVKEFAAAIKEELQ